MGERSLISKKFDLLSTIFMTIGFVLLALTAIEIFQDAVKKKDSVPCTGVIVYWARRNPVRIAFEYEDELYIRSYNGRNSSWYEGETIEILYNPVKDRIYLPSMNTVRNIVLVGLALIFGLGGLIPFIVGRRKVNRVRRLKEEGVCLECTIIDVYINESISMNSSNPVVITCSFKNSDDIEYRFKSGNVLVDSYDDYKVGDTIKVYANRENYKDYFVETNV